MKIIVQAGGLGTRMRALTTNKPKALIPVKNSPILFHLLGEFNRPEDEFIIIGDYKYDVLDRYLSTFAKKQRYILIKSSVKGNASGIREALSYVPDNEPVLLVWSDLILPEGFKNVIDACDLKGGCAIGTVDFPCSWRVENNQFVHEKGDKNGVAGLYVFANKSLLDTVPVEGSFTTWLSEQKFPMQALRMDGCIDIGTIEAYQNVETSQFRCRPYNHIEVKEHEVIKTGLTDEAKTFVLREISWYEKAQEYGFKHVPKLISKSPLTLSRVHGDNIFLAGLDEEGRAKALDKMCKALAALHQCGKASADAWDLYQEYFTKTIDRLRSIATALPFAERSTIRINGKDCPNVLLNLELFRRCVLETLMDTHYALYHGDCQLTNTLIDKSGDIFFIDPRGYFGKTKNIGDIRYDWVKVYYAIVGNFDQFNVKNFELKLDADEVTFSIGSSGWESLVKQFFDQIPADEGTEKEIKLIHAIVWLSLASHAWEDFDSMCVAFYNGTALFAEWMENYRG